jgi:hypothetical protein
MDALRESLYQAGLRQLLVDRQAMRVDGLTSLVSNDHWNRVSEASWGQYRRKYRDADARQVQPA